MEELWKIGRSSSTSGDGRARQGHGKKRAYTTYMTIMARLHKKGVLVRRREGKTDFYAPSQDRSNTWRCALAPRSRTWSRNTATWR